MVQHPAKSFNIRHAVSETWHSLQSENVHLYVHALGTLECAYDLSEVGPDIWTEGAYSARTAEKQQEPQYYKNTAADKTKQQEYTNEATCDQIRQAKLFLNLHTG